MPVVVLTRSDDDERLAIGHGATDFYVEPETADLVPIFHLIQNAYLA